MKCLDDCHLYELDTMAGKTEVLNFYRLDPDGLKHDGVTNEEVIKVLIHRLKYLNETWQDGKFDSSFNRRAISGLENALYCLEARTRDRERREVEGTHNP